MSEFRVIGRKIKRGLDLVSAFRHEVHRGRCRRRVDVLINAEGNMDGGIIASVRSNSAWSKTLAWLCHANGSRKGCSQG